MRLTHLTLLTQLPLPASRHLRRHLCRGGFIAFLPLLVCAASLPSVPAPREPSTNTYHGVAVVDDYQWLEDASAPAVRDWSRLENERTRAYFARLPFRDGIADQLTQLRSEESARYLALEQKHGRLFALRFKPDRK